MKNYYEILEVNENASFDIIKKIYKIQIKKYHPDLYEDEKKEEMEEKIKDINEAYETLSDEEKRANYDKTLEELKKENIKQDIKEDIEEDIKEEDNEEVANEQSSVNDNYDAYFNNKTSEIMLNQLNRFESILSRYEQAFNEVSNHEIEDVNENYKVSNMEVFKFKAKRVLMYVGIIAITLLLLYLIPFTRNIFTNIFAIFIK